MPITNRLDFVTPTSSIDSQKPLFIFLPGLDGTGTLLYTQVERLAPYFDLRCLIMPRNDVSGWYALVSQVINLIQRELKINSDRQVYLCGESFGSCLTLLTAARVPKLIDRLIVINPASSFNQREILTTGIHITEWMPDFVYPLSTLILLPFLGALGKMNPSESRALLKAMQSIPPKIAAWRLSLLRDFTLTKEDIQYFTKPVLIIASGSDRLLPSLEEAQRLVKILPQSKIVVLRDSGHACLLETDIQLDQILQQENFLEKGDRTSVV